ncbi:MAG TPA: PAS domain-containing protein [Gaiellaceae bacterium]|nr:PAS domain-containing protein [Gaiellaceae bacterium]
MPRLVPAAVVGLGLLLSAGALLLVSASEHEENAAFVATASLVVAWSFILGGLVAWARRPDNGFGALLCAVGLASFLGTLAQANEPIPFTVGFVYGGLFLAVFVHALLAFPRGYLETRLVYAIVGVAYGAATIGTTLTSLFTPQPEGCPDCPEIAIAVTDSPVAADVVWGIVVALLLPALGALLYLFYVRWRAASVPLRRVLFPVYVTAGASLLLLAVTLVVESFAADAAQALWWVLTFTFASVPAAFIVGLLSGRLARAGVGKLLLEVGRAAHAPGELRDALARALGDPTLRLAYWLPDAETFVDIEGRPLELPEPNGEELVTIVEREGRPVAALIHHRSLEEDPLLVEAAATAAAFTLENERRHAALAKAQARNRALLDAVPDLMFRMDRDGTYLEVKGEPEDLAGPPEELVGSRAHEVLPPEVAGPLVEGIRRAIDTGEGVTGEYTLELNGVPRDFEARIVKAGDEAVLIVREFTERNRAQTEMKRLHQELQQRHRDLENERDFIRAVVDSTPSLLCLVTPGGYVVRFNNTLERLSGRRDDDRNAGSAFWDLFIAPEEREAVREELLEIVGEGGRGEYENTWITASGERRLVAWSTTPLRDHEGQPRLLVSGIDITERKQQEEELRRSRARLVETSDIERRRLERNLHDGAQQRLVSLSLVLRLAQAKVATDPEGADRLLAQAAEELAAALEELRELARGIHPAVLADRGLYAALEVLAARAPLPVDLELVDERLPEPVEAAAYYVVSEALANVVKYADASSVAVSIARMNGRAVVEIADDGVGGADPSLGSGLRGLVDRVEALDGRLQVESPPGAGTRIRAEIPCE